MVSARVDGVDVGSISNNAFNFAAAGLSRVSIPFQCNAKLFKRANCHPTKFLVVGLSNVGSDIFEFKSSKVGDVITLRHTLRTCIQSRRWD